jgi:hypothetical protein
MEHTHNHGTSSHPSKTTASFRFVLGILLCNLVESLALLMIVVNQDLDAGRGIPESFATPPKLLSVSRRGCDVR